MILTDMFVTNAPPPDHHPHHPRILTWDFIIGSFEILVRLTPENERRNHVAPPLHLAVRCFEKREV